MSFISQLFMAKNVEVKLGSLLFDMSLFIICVGGMGCYLCGLMPWRSEAV